MKNANRNRNQNVAPNADDFLGGNYLRKEDIHEPRNLTVGDVWSETVRGSSRPKLVIGFVEIEKALILNKTNTKHLTAIFGTPDTSQWRGAVRLYVEKSVEFGGRVVGGLRIEKPKIANGPMLVDDLATMVTNGSGFNGDLS